MPRRGGCGPARATRRTGRARPGEPVRRSVRGPSGAISPHRSRSAVGTPVPTLTTSPLPRRPERTRASTTSSTKTRSRDLPPVTGEHWLRRPVAAADTSAATTPPSGRWRGPYAAGQRQRRELDAVRLAVRGEEVDDRLGHHAAHPSGDERPLLDRQLARRRMAVQRRRRQRHHHLADTVAPGRLQDREHRGERLAQLGGRAPTVAAGRGGRSPAAGAARRGRPAPPSRRVWIRSWLDTPAATAPRASLRLPNDPVERSSTTSTTSPSAIRRSTRCDPRNPAPPMTSTPPVDTSSSDPSLGGDSGVVDVLTVGNLGVGTDHRANDRRGTGPIVPATTLSSTTASRPIRAPGRSTLRGDAWHHR